MQNSTSNIIVVPIKYVLISDKQPMGYDSQLAMAQSARECPGPGNFLGDVWGIIQEKLSGVEIIRGGGLSEGELSSYQNIWGNPGHNVQG